MAISSTTKDDSYHSREVQGGDHDEGNKIPFHINNLKAERRSLNRCQNELRVNDLQY